MIEPASLNTGKEDMPIVALRNLNEDDYAEKSIGKELCKLAWFQFIPLMGQTGLNLSYESCNAAVAVNRNQASIAYSPGSDSEQRQQPIMAMSNGAGFGAVFGNSRLFTGLDPDNNVRIQNAGGRPRPDLRNGSSFRGEHAEQGAILNALHKQMSFWRYRQQCHLYVDYSPCLPCTDWLVARPEPWFVHYFRDHNPDGMEQVKDDKRELRKVVYGTYKQRG